MLWSAIGDALPFAVGLALSPFAVVTAVVLLMGHSAILKTSLFGIGWLTAIFAITTVAYLIVDVAEDADPEATADGVDIIQLLLGLFFFALAALSWHKRPKPGEAESKSKLLTRLDSISALGTLGLGLAQGVVVIKNIPLAAGAGAGLAEARLSGADPWIALLIFAIVASAGVLVPLTVRAVGGQRVAGPLASARQWLEANMSPITMVVLLLIGSVFLGQGLALFG